MDLRFDAPWSSSLTVITALMVGVLLVMWAALGWVGAGLIGALFALAAAGVVRGYTVDTDAVVVRRPGWSTRLDLAGLEAVEVAPDVLRRSTRTFGMGGPFAFLGWFESPDLGPFMAYATDPDRAVVLQWIDRTVVVTPDDPDTFVAAVEAAVAGARRVDLPDPMPEAERGGARTRSRS